MTIEMDVSKVVRELDLNDMTEYSKPSCHSELDSIEEAVVNDVSNVVKGLDPTVVVEPFISKNDNLLNIKIKCNDGRIEIFTIKREYLDDKDQPWSRSNYREKIIEHFGRGSGKTCSLLDQSIIYSMIAASQF